MYPVLVKQIKITKPTMAITGLSSYDEIVAKKATLFNKQTDAQLIETYNKIHGNKLTENPIVSLPKEQKRLACINALTFQLELTQEVDKPVNENSTANPVLGMFLAGRANVSSSSLVGIKYFWQTSSFQFIQDNGFAEGFNLSEYFAQQNTVFYLLRTHTFNPTVNKNGMITDSPKRPFKGGNILTKDNQLIFQTVSVVARPSQDVEVETEAVAELEKQNAKYFIANGFIDANEVPEEIKQGELFNNEFQDWLQDQYATRNLKMQTSIA